MFEGERRREGGRGREADERGTNHVQEREIDGKRLANGIDKKKKCNERGLTQMGERENILDKLGKKLSR